MKKLFLVLTVLFLSSYNIFPQWTSESNLFSVNSGTKLESCVSVNGTHVVYSYNGALNYAYLNSSGTIVSMCQLESSNCDFPNIVSSGTNLYAVYKKNNQINIKVSTNLGSTWGTAHTYGLKNTGCNDLKAVFNQSSIHIVWSELRTGYQYVYDAHYVEFYYSQPTFQNYKQVTDLENDGGDRPRAAITSNKLYVVYKSDPLLLYGREKNLTTGEWGGVESVPVLDMGEEHGDEFTAFLVFHNLYATNDRFSVSYKIEIHDIYNESASIAHCYKLYSGGSWVFNSSGVITSSLAYPTFSTITKDNLINVLGWALNNGYVHYTIYGSTLSGMSAAPTLYENSSLSCGSKDLYLFKIPNSFPYYLKYQKYDDTPLTPSITGSVYRTENNAHPLIYWEQYIEPDVTANTIDGFRIERILDSGSPFYFNISGNNSSYTDWNVNYAGAGPCHAFYKVKAKDTGGKSSNWSNTADIAYGEAWKSGEITSNYNFELHQNYPNPFNPTTNISYSIPEVSNVQITIYDMLGREVAELFKSTKQPGNHSVQWDASEYPQRYIYLPDYSYYCWK